MSRPLSIALSLLAILGCAVPAACLAWLWMRAWGLSGVGLALASALLAMPRRLRYSRGWRHWCGW